MKRILICDDHLLFAQCLQELILQREPKSGIVLSRNVIELEIALNTMDFDVVILDVNLREEDSFSFLEKNRELFRTTKVIVLTGFYEEYLIRRAIRLGVKYFFHKDIDHTILLSTIFSDLQDEYLPQISPNDELIVSLTNQEKNIIRLVLKGKQSKEIALDLNISKSTVDTHRRNINRKLNLSGTGDLILWAYENRVEV